MKIGNFFTFLLIISLMSCGNNGNKNMAANELTSDTTAIVGNQAGTTEDLSEYGLLKDVEDAGYPLAILTIDFSDRNFSETFTINMEKVPNANLQTLNGYKGKNVNFTYTTSSENALLDLHLNGKSLLGMDAEIVSTNLKTIEGVFNGPNQETAGDLPDKISITGADNQTLSFDFFVTREMVAVNGKKVKGYYDIRNNNEITSITLKK